MKMDLLNDSLFDLIGEYVDYIFITVGIMIVYLFVRPLISWLVTLKSIRLLSYLMSSLLVFILLLLALHTIEELDDLLFKAFLQCLAVFGVVLLLFHVFKYARKKA